MSAPEPAERQRVSLALPPAESEALGDFPARSLGGNVVLFRVVLADLQPWWFGSSGDGRFDLPTPDGTCYLATDAAAAVVEALGGGLSGGVVPRAFVEQRRLRRLRVPFVHRVADLASRRARRYGVTAEIHTVVPYDRPQAWAVALRRAGFDGVSYLARHDPSAATEALALFGRSGERRSWRRGRAVRIDSTVLERLWRDWGIAVADIPVTAQLRVLE